MSTSKTAATATPAAATTSEFLEYAASSNTAAAAAPFSSSSASASSSPSSLAAFTYEVHGKVQGVFFRKHTQKVAQELKIVGWVMNTPHGSVVGEAEGPQAKLCLFETWLTNTGSPKSRIDRVDIHNRRSITSRSASSFEFRK